MDGAQAAIPGLTPGETAGRSAIPHQNVPSNPAGPIVLALLSAGGGAWQEATYR